MGFWTTTQRKLNDEQVKPMPDWVRYNLFLFKLRKFVCRHHRSPVINNVISRLLNAANGRCYFNHDASDVQEEINRYCAAVEELIDPDYEAVIAFIQQAEGR